MAVTVTRTHFGPRPLPLQTSYVNGIFAYFRPKLARFGNLGDLLSRGFCGCVRNFACLYQLRAQN